MLSFERDVARRWRCIRLGGVGIISHTFRHAQFIANRFEALFTHAAMGIVVVKGNGIVSL